MKNKRTTAAGVACAIATGLAAYLENHGVSAKDLVIMAGQLALGYFAKDFNITGVGR